MIHRPVGPRGPWRNLVLALSLVVLLSLSLMGYFYIRFDRAAVVAADADLQSILATRFEEFQLMPPAARAVRAATLWQRQANSTEVGALLGRNQAIVAGAPIRRAKDGYRLPGLFGEAVAARQIPLSDGQALLVGVRMTPYRQRIWDTWLAIGVAALMVSVPLPLLTFIDQRRLDRRLAALSQACAAIGEGRLATRLPLSGRGDELDTIAEATNEMVRQLSSLMDALDRQASDISHEFNTCAGRIGACVARLKEDTAMADQPALTAIEREQKAIVASTNAILRLARARAGGLPMTPQNLAMLAAQVVDIQEASAELRDIAVELEAEGASVLGDADHLRMMLSNLIGNAIKFTPAGGRIKIATARGGGSMAVLRVEDSGPGVAIADRERIFQRLVRVGDADHAPGHGHGLAIVAAVVERHRGTIRVTDSALGGACFVVSFPEGPTV